MQPHSSDLYRALYRVNAYFPDTFCRGLQAETKTSHSKGPMTVLSHWQQSAVTEAEMENTSSTEALHSPECLALASVESLNWDSWTSTGVWLGREGEALVSLAEWDSRLPSPLLTFALCRVRAMLPKGTQEACTPPHCVQPPPVQNTSSLWTSLILKNMLLWFLQAKSMEK